MSMSDLMIRQKTEHNDKDLVQLAGLHAYGDHKEGDDIEVNGKTFRVEHVHENPDSGLDAFTVRNVTVIDENGNLSLENNEDGELIIVYVGSESEDWALTNLHLSGPNLPLQPKEGNQYYKKINNNTIRGLDIPGGVDSVTGNSLGGANANYVGIKNPEVNVVTLNPAMLTEGIVDPNENYDNIHNYYGDIDVLTRLQLSIQMDSRIPGKKTTIKTGLPIPNLNIFKSNHTGYLHGDNDGKLNVVEIDGQYAVEIGREGEPGHGHILYGADRHVVMSLWNNTPLNNTSTERIKIDTPHLLMLADGIKGDLTSRLTTAGNYIEKSNEIVKDQRAKFDQRVTKLQETFQDLIYNNAGDIIFKEITSTGHMIKESINSMIYFIDQVESKCQLLKNSLNNVSFDLIDILIPKKFDLELIFSPAKEKLNELKDEVDKLILNFSTVIHDIVPALMRSTKHGFVDAVTGELFEHFSILEENKEALHQQYENFETKVRDVANSFYSMDEQIGFKINRSLDVNLEINQSQELQHDFNVTDSPYLEEGKKLKEFHQNLIKDTLKTDVTLLLLPIVGTIYGISTSLLHISENIRNAINNTVNYTLDCNLIGSLVSKYTNYDIIVRDRVRDALKPLREFEEIVEPLSIAFSRMTFYLPQVVDDFSPYVDQALFLNEEYGNIHLYCMSAETILEESELVFNDITYQLSANKGKSINDCLTVAQTIKQDISKLNGQVSRYVNM